MTNEQRLYICAELARAMEWTEVVFACSPPIGIPPGEQDFAVVPDPFTDAADNRALVAWMAADDSRWERFYAWTVVESLGLHPGNDSPLAVVRDVITAPLETITLAAAKALGIEVEAND